MLQYWKHDVTRLLNSAILNMSSKEKDISLKENWDSFSAMRNCYYECFQTSSDMSFVNQLALPRATIFVTPTVMHHRVAEALAFPEGAQKGNQGMCRINTCSRDSSCHLCSLLPLPFKSHLKAPNWIVQTSLTATLKIPSVSFNT